MKRFAVMAIAAVAAVCLFAQPAFATSPHFKGKTPIVFTDGGLFLRATASYAGLGNFDTEQRVDATGNPTATCTNPAGQTQPPGQNPAEADVSGATAIPAGDIKNGNVTITTDTNSPETPIPGAPQCPNGQWTEDITDMAFTSATVRLFQDANGDHVFQDSELVLTATCTFSPPTSNGPVPASGVTCS
jgi:hypothetical protein